jgi:glycosyltransferase involved in cell wall biosynthesis
MKRVLTIIHYPVLGGPHSQALRLAPALEEHGWQTTILLSDEPGNAADILRSEGLDVVTVPLRRLRGTLRPSEHIRSASSFAPEVHTIRRLIRERDIDVVQINGLVNVQGAVAARGERRPLVWQLIDTRTPLWFRRMLMPTVIRWSDVVMTTGAAVAAVHPGCDRLGDRLRVFFMPVDPEAFAPDAWDRAQSRAAFGFEESDLVVGTVGNLNPQKGHEHLLRTIARVRMDADVERVRGLIVGASHETHRAYERKLNRLASSLALEVGNDVVFTGGLRDVRPALAAMDLFLLTSVPHSEGAPAAVEEAMMMSRAVVATDVGSISEVVQHGVTGLVVPPLEIESLRDATSALLRDPQRRLTMGAHGRERALAHFSTRECAAVHAAAYEKAMSRRRVTAR